MSSFLFALLAVILLSFGARDQLLVASMSKVRGSTSPLFAVSAFSSMATVGLMVVAGASIVVILPGPAQLMLMAFAALAAAIELARRVRGTALKEPTQSLGAFTIVLCSKQISDAARFAIFALAASGMNPWLVGLGGAMGGTVGLYLGWALGDELEKWPLTPIRRVMAGLAIGLALFMAMSARGLFGLSLGQAG